MSKPKAKSRIERICCLTGNEGWTAPEGDVCMSRRHGHMTLSKVDALVDDGRMEWVKGIQVQMRMGRQVEVQVWIPVARFTVAKQWRKTISDPHGAAPMACMQLR